MNMNDQFKEKTFTEEYKFYLMSLFRAPVIIPILLIILFAYINKDGDSEKLWVVLEMLIAFFGGIASTQFMKYLNKKSEGSKIRLKASGAIRNLIGIDDKLKNIIGRIKAKGNMKEIRNLAIILQSDISDAKDDWGDIVDIGEINKYRGKITIEKQEREQIERLLEKINESKYKEGDSLKKEGDLLKKLKEKDLEIEKIQAGFDNYKSTNNLNMLGDVSASLSLSPTVNASYLLGQNICEKCHKPYNPTTVSLATEKQNFICEKCKLMAGNYVS